MKGLGWFFLCCSVWVFCCPVYGSATTITAAEAFVNTDPGQGFGTPLTPPAGESLDEALEILIGQMDLTSLPPGRHTLFIRFQDSTGLWSPTVAQTLAIPQGVSVGGANTITAAEVFIDTDPGEGVAIPMMLPPNETLDEALEVLIANLDVSGLAPGLHTLYYRFQDATGLWSPTQAQTLLLPYDMGLLPEVNRIVAAEYHVDALPSQLPPAEDGSFDQSAETIHEQMILAPARHRVFTRFQDSLGRWSDEEPLPAALAHDSDWDGLPDSWELTHFGHLGYDGNDDPDNDGKTNHEELLLGTSPGAFEGGSTPLFSGQVRDMGGQGLVSVAICIEGNGLADCSLRTDANGNWQSWPQQPLPSGSYRIDPQPTQQSGDLRFVPAFRVEAISGSSVSGIDFTGEVISIPPLPVTAGHLLGDPARSGMAVQAAGFGVNAVTSNFFHREEDVALPGIEVPFVLSRGYNSQANDMDSFGQALFEPLGPGWTHTYNLSLSAIFSQAEMIWGDGRRDGFIKTGGTWTAASPGNFADLQEVTGQNYAWELTTREQIRYRFQADGRLLAIVGRNGYTLTLAYNGLDFTVTDTAGRTIDFLHDGQGRLFQIQLPLARTLGFAYNGSGLLEEVTDMRGRHWRYVYTDVNGEQKLSRIYRAESVGLDDRVALDIHYDANGRVDEQNTGHTLALSGDYRFDWSTPDSLHYQAPSGQGADFVWDSRLRVIRVTPINTPGAVAQDFRYPLDDNSPNSLLPDRIDDGEGNTYALSYQDFDLDQLTLPVLPVPFDLDYNLSHDVIGMTLPQGSSLGITRDTQGKPERITFGGGGLQQAKDATLTYFPNGAHAQLLQNLTSPGDPGSEDLHTEIVAYHADGQPTEIRSYLDGNNFLTTRRAYDGAGRLVREEDHRSTLTCFYYDANDNLLDEIRGSTGACPSDPASAPASTSVRHTCHSYDDSNRRSSTTSSCGHATEARTRTFTFNTTSGVLSKVVDHNGLRETRFFYNDDLDLFRTEFAFPNGDDREDRHFRLASDRILIDAENINGSQSTLARFERREFDGNDRLLTIASCIAMANAGDSSSDCNGHTERLRIQRDALGRPEQVLETLNGSNRATDLAYSTDGRTITVTHQADANNQTMVLTSDSEGRLIQVVEQQQGGPAITMTAEYDANGRLIHQLGPEAGVDTHFTYDGLGRRRSRTDMQGTMRWVYDDNANRITQTMDGDTAVVIYSFNSLNELVQVDTQDGPQNNQFTFEYDSRGLLKREAWSGSGGTGERRYRYTVYGDLDQTTGPYGQVIDYARDDLGRITQRDYGAETTLYSHNAFGQIKTIGGTFLPAGLFSFNYDSFTQLLSQINYPTAGQVAQFQHNPSGGLVGQNVQQPGGGNFVNYQFDLDPGNATINRWRRDVISAEQPLAPAFVPETLQFGYANSRLASINGNPVGYDGRGNLTSLPAPIQGSYTYDALNRLLDANSTTHRYDATRNRIETVRDGETTRYVWDLSGSLPDLLAELDENNQIQTRYLHGPGGLLGRKLNNGTMRFVLQDFNRNVVALTDSNGVDSTYAYTPYGQSAGSTGEADFPFRFAGGVGAMTDPEQLIYMRARYYHPGIRQFISADLVPGVLARPQSLGRYGYVEGRVLSGVDSSGLFLDAFKNLFGPKKRKVRPARSRLAQLGKFSPVPKNRVEDMTNILIPVTADFVTTALSSAGQIIGASGGRGLGPGAVITATNNAFTIAKTDLAITARDERELRRLCGSLKEEGNKPNFGVIREEVRNRVLGTRGRSFIDIFNFIVKTNNNEDLRLDMLTGLVLKSLNEGCVSGD